MSLVFLSSWFRKLYGSNWIRVRNPDFVVLTINDTIDLTYDSFWRFLFLIFDAHNNTLDFYFCSVRPQTASCSLFVSPLECSALPHNIFTKEWTSDSRFGAFKAAQSLGPPRKARSCSWQLVLDNSQLLVAVVGAVADHHNILTHQQSLLLFACSKMRLTLNSHFFISVLQFSKKLWILCTQCTQTNARKTAVFALIWWKILADFF